MTGAAPIQVQNLNHSFGKGHLRKQILFNVTTEIHRGKILDAGRTPGCTLKGNT